MSKKIQCHSMDGGIHEVEIPELIDPLEAENAELRKWQEEAAECMEWDLVGKTDKEWNDYAKKQIELLQQAKKEPK